MARSRRRSSSDRTTSAIGDRDVLRLTSDAPSFIQGETMFATRPVTLVFGVDEPFLSDIDSTAKDFEMRTRAHCSNGHARSAPFEWQSETIRSAITLKLCSFEETGAIIAAHTRPRSPKRRARCATGIIGLLATRRLFRGRRVEQARRDADDGILHQLLHHGGRRSRRTLSPCIPSCRASRWTKSTSRQTWRAIAVRVPCASAMPPQSRPSTTSTAAAWFRRRSRCLSTIATPKMGDEALFRRLEQLGERGGAR